MNNFSNNRRRKNTKPGPLVFIIVAYLLVQFLSAVDRDGFGVMLIALLVPVLAIAIFFFAFRMISKNTVKNRAEVKKSSKKDEYCKTCSDEFVYNNRQAEYNEYSAEEHFVRDRQRRLRQLDEFLKNGLIDKNEYMVLRSHYER